MSKKWQALQWGDIVDVVAPASACKPQELRAGIRYLKSLGLVPRVAKNILKPTPLNFAQSDEVRFQQLKSALLAKDSKAIWCLRGGYGSLKLVPQLSKLKKPKHSKVLLGFSDITTLHAFLNQEWKWPTLHSPVLTRMGSEKARPIEQREVAAMLFGRKPEQVFTGLKPLNSAARLHRKIRGHVVGGNLAVLQSGLGTPWELRTKNQIIFLEDIGEKPYRVDRMLEQWSQGGAFEKAKAIVFGSFSMENARDMRLLWNDVIPRFAKKQKIPVLNGLRVGHGNQQHTLPFLTDAELRLGSKPTLKVATGFRA